MLENPTSPHGIAKDDAVRELLQQLLERRFVLTDRGGSVTRWSLPAESLLGWKGEGVLGRPLLEVLACEPDLPTDGGSCSTLCRRQDGSELGLGLTFVPVPMSQSLEFTGMLETLEAGAPADVTLDRLHRRHSPVIEWMAACLAGEAQLEDGELSAGTIIAFRPTDESEWGEGIGDDAEPAAPGDGGAEAHASPDFVGRVHEALQRSAALEEALDSASAALEEARSGSYEARDDARAARLEAAEAAARIGQLEQRNRSLGEELEATRRDLGETAARLAKPAEALQMELDRMRGEVREAFDQMGDPGAELEELRRRLEQSEADERRRLDAELEQARSELRSLAARLERPDEVRDELEQAKQELRTLAERLEQPDQALRAELEQTRGELQSLADRLEQPEAGLRDELLETRRELDEARAQLDVLSGRLEQPDRRLAEDLEQTREQVKELAERVDRPDESWRDELRAALEGQAETRSEIEAVRARLNEAPGRQLPAPGKGRRGESRREETRQARQAAEEAAKQARDARRAQETASATAEAVRRAGDEAAARLRDELERMSTQVARSAEHAASAEEAAASVERVQEAARRVEEGLARAEEVAAQVERGASTAEEVVARSERGAARAEEVLQQAESGATRAEAAATRLERGASHVEEIAARVELGASRSEEAADRAERGASDAFARIEAVSAQAEEAAERASAEAAGLRELGARLEERLAAIEAAAATAEVAALQAQEAMTSAGREAAGARESAERSEVEAKVAKVQSEAARVHAQEAGRQARSGSAAGLRPGRGLDAMPSSGTRRFVKPLRPKRLAAPDRELQPGFDDAESPMAKIDLDGHFRELNTRFSELVGFSESEFQAATWPPVTDRENLAKHRKELGAIMSGEVEATEVDTSYVHAQGLQVPVRGRLSLVRDESGEANHLLLEVAAPQRA